MLPYVNLFGKSLPTYSLMMILAFVSGLIVISLRRKYFCLSRRMLLIIGIISIISGYIGCNALYNLENIDEVQNYGWAFSGLSFFGGIIVAPFVIILFSKLIKVNKGKLLDICALGIPLVLSIVRIGCYCGGCCGGYIIINGHTRELHTQLIDSLLNVSIFIQILIFEHYNLFSNYHFMFFLFEYGLGRIVIEHFRLKSIIFLSMSNGQILGLICVIISIVILFINRKELKESIKGRGVDYNEK